jgi:hypothetical protein
MRRAIATSMVIALAMWLSACGGSDDTPADRSLLESESPNAEAGGKKAKRADKKQRGRKKAGGKTGAAVAAPDQPGAIPEHVDVPGADEEKEYPTASSEVDEPKPDADSQGVTPGYAEVLNASVEGLGNELRVTFVMNGDIPDRMPTEETIMVIGFQVLRGSEEGYVLAAQATNKGWKPYAGGKEKQTKFPGSFSIEGNSFVLTAPWSYFDGAYPFKWIATSNWFQSLANTTHYMFDLVPNKSQANYPA